MEILEVMSDIDGLGDLSESIKRTMSRDTVDELNYLAARLQTLQDGIGYDEMFAAVIEAKRYDGSVTGLINLTFTENLNRFDLLPAFSNEQYGDFLVNFAGDESADAFKRLDDSGEPGDKELARYIEKLEKYVDRAAYGRDAIKADNGVLTEKGVLLGGDGLQEMYHGPRDIPAEYRVFTEPGEAGKQTLKISGVDIAATVIKLHAVCGGDNMSQAAENLKTLMSGQSRNYLLLIEGGNVCLSPAIEAYKSGAETSAFVSSSAGSPDFMAFAVRVNKRGEDGVTGDLVELNGKALCANVSHHTVAPERIDAVLLGGQAKSYDLWSWINLPQSARGDIRSYASRFPDSGLTEAAGCYASFMDANETVSEAAGMDAFLANANTAFMDAAENRRPGMIRVAKDAALEMLARGDGEVYRLIPDGVNKLVPIVAARLARYTGRCEFAVKREDLTGLDKWAERAVNKLTRQNERGERDKSIYQREAL
jgi:hypothetical protein